MTRKNHTGRYDGFGLPGRLIGNVRMLFLLVNDYIHGRYRRVPIRAMAVLVFALVYIFCPFDIIPDYLPGYGQIDDAVVALLCLYLLEKDIDAYKKWRSIRDKEC